MNSSLMFALAGVAVAIAVTTAMDASGYVMFSSLALLPITLLFWFLQKFSRHEMGLIWGDLRSYVIALAYPIVVLGLIAVIAFLAGAVDTREADWERTQLNILLGSTVGMLTVLLTEEGFFRGWLWAALTRAGQSDVQVLVWTSLIFTVWHLSAISLDTGFNIPAGEIPIYLVNATFIGAIFGLLRLISGSVLVATVGHTLWNAIDYPLFGFGEKVGALGIQATHIYGPEVGILGILVNGLFFLALLRLWDKRQGSR